MMSTLISSLVSGYREPLCYELTGHTARLEPEAGQAATLSFLSDTEMEKNGVRMPWACLKLSARRYLLSLPLPGEALLLDLRRARFAGISRGGALPPVSGAVVSDFTLAPEIERPFPADRLTGQCLIWRLSPRASVTQAFPARGIHALSGDIEMPASPVRVLSIGGDLCALAFDYHRPGTEQAPVLALCDMNALRGIGCCLLPEHENLLFSMYGGFVGEEEA